MIFGESRSILLGNPIFLSFFRGGGGGSGLPVPPLDMSMCIMCRLTLMPLSIFISQKDHVLYAMFILQCSLKVSITYLSFRSNSNMQP